MTVSPPGAMMIRLSRRRDVICILGVVMLVGYAFHRQNSAPPPSQQQVRSLAFAIRAMPASSIPPARSAKSSELQATAKTLPQLHAAFRESQQCIEEQLISRANSINHEVAPQPHIPGCDDMKGAFGRMHDATQAAAEAGDLAAQMCYLIQAGSDRDSGFALTEAQVAEYRSLAPRYVEAAFARGDWRVVELLGFRVVDWAPLFVSYLEPWKDPARLYKAHQLLLLGAGDVDPQDPDAWLATLRAPRSQAGWGLSEQQIRDADEWVRDTYEEYFSSRPRLTEEPRACTYENSTG